MKNIFSSEHDQVNKVNDEANRAWEADHHDRVRNIRNWSQYFALEGSQWPFETKAKLNQQNRHASQYNIIGPKVDALTGSLIQEEFDLDWRPLEGSRNSLTEAVKTSYYADKELCNYDKNIEAVIRDSLIQLGVMKMHMSEKHNPLRNIAFKRVEPGFVFFDPHWVTDDDSECKKAWEFFHISAEDIAERFGITSPEIDAQIKWDRIYGGDFEHEHGTVGDLQFATNTRSNNPNYLFEVQRKGHLWKVIEFHWLDEVNTTRLIGQKLDSEQWMPFPITNEKAKLNDFMIRNQIDPLNLIEAPYKDVIHHVTTICSELSSDKVLEDGISVIQPKRLPYFQLTANRAFGKNKGVVDDLFDIQQTINKRESKLTDLISTAQGGGKIVNKNLFDGVAEMEEFRKKANDPSAIFFADGDEMSKEKTIQYLNSNTYPSQVIDQLERMWQIVDRVSKVPAAVEAISENANESGILFERKLQVARINTITIVNRVRDFRKTLAEAYFNQWQLAYNGPEREFSTSDGKQHVILNKRVFRDGKVYIQNRPDQVDRCMVIATESKTAPNKQIRDRAIYSDLYNLAVQSNPEYTGFFFKKLLQTMDLDDEDRRELSDISRSQNMRDIKRIDTESTVLDSNASQARLAGAQSEVQLQQLFAAAKQPKPQQLPQAEVAEEDLPIDNNLEEGELPSPQEEQEVGISADLA